MSRIQFVASGRGSVGHRDAAGPAVQQGVYDRARGAAGAQHHDRGPVGVEVAEAAQGFGESVGVGVVANEVPGVADDGVDGAGALGGKREAVHGAKGGQFVGDGHV